VNAAGADRGTYFHYPKVRWTPFPVGSIEGVRDITEYQQADLARVIAPEDDLPQSRGVPACVAARRECSYDEATVPLNRLAAPPHERRLRPRAPVGHHIEAQAESPG
jgi:hypothetical protein